MKLYKNSQGMYRVALSPGRWLRDEDLEFAISSNHKSVVLNFRTPAEAYEAYSKYLNNQEILKLGFSRKDSVGCPVVREDFVEVV